MKRDNHRASMICDNYAFPVFLPPAFFFSPLSPDFVSLKNPFFLFLCETLFEITCQKMAFPEGIFRFLRRFMYSRILLEGKTFFKVKKKKDSLSFPHKLFCSWANLLFSFFGGGLLRKEPLQLSL